MKCPNCKGSGKVTGTYIEDDKEEKFPCKCYRCMGKGTITKAENDAYKAMMDAMCSCDNPSEEATFYDDGQHPNCSKHCWVCNDCGKIKQVG